MPEFTYAKGRISETIQFILREMNEFEKDYSSKDIAEYQNDTKLQKLMDRTVENILTALIELGGTVLVEENISAESYIDVLKKSTKLFGLSENEQETLSKLATARNRLAHRYLNFRWQAIRMFADSKQLVKKLLSAVLEREKNKI